MLSRPSISQSRVSRFAQNHKKLSSHQYREKKRPGVTNASRDKRKNFKKTFNVNYLQKYPKRDPNKDLDALSIRVTQKIFSPIHLEAAGSRIFGSQAIALYRVKKLNISNDPRHESASNANIDELLSSMNLQNSFDTTTTTVNNFDNQNITSAPSTSFGQIEQDIDKQLFMPTRLNTLPSISPNLNTTAPTNTNYSSHQSRYLAPDDPHLSEEYLTQQLQRHWGYSSFREGQLETIQNILQGKSSLTVIPTGSGKSICFQLPALILPGLALIVSPLISLMKDQLIQIPPSINAAVWNHNTTLDEISLILHHISQGTLKILLLSPEKLLGVLFQRQLLLHLHRSHISFVCIDEAHCLSEWSHGFRPTYLRLRDVTLNIFKCSTLLALTATATQKTISDLSLKLHITQQNIICFPRIRKNLFITSCRVPLLFKQNNLLTLLQTPQFQEILQTSENNARKQTHNDESSSEEHLKRGGVLIYCSSQLTCERLSHFLNHSGYRSAYYHADLPPMSRNHVQNIFMCDKIQILCATIAFGLGVNKPNIRAIIHYNISRSIESYMQEIGRGGRDGNLCYCVTMFTEADATFARARIHSDLIPKNSVDEFMIDILREMMRNLRYVCAARQIQHDSNTELSQFNSNRITKKRRRPFTAETKPTSVQTTYESVIEISKRPFKSPSDCDNVTDGSDIVINTHADTAESLVLLPKPIKLEPALTLNKYQTFVLTQNDIPTNGIHPLFQYVIVPLLRHRMKGRTNAVFKHITDQITIRQQHFSPASSSGSLVDFNIIALKPEEFFNSKVMKLKSAPRLTKEAITPFNRSKGLNDDEKQKGISRSFVASVNYLDITHLYSTLLSHQRELSHDCTQMTAASDSLATGNKLSKVPSYFTITASNNKDKTFVPFSFYMSICSSRYRELDIPKSFVDTLINTLTSINDELYEKMHSLSGKTCFHGVLHIQHTPTPDSFDDVAVDESTDHFHLSFFEWLPNTYESVTVLFNTSPKTLISNLFHRARTNPAVCQTYNILVEIFQQSCTLPYSTQIIDDDDGDFTQWPNLTAVSKVKYPLNLSLAATRLQIHPNKIISSLNELSQSRCIQLNLPQSQTSTLRINALPQCFDCLCETLYERLYTCHTNTMFKHRMFIQMMVLASTNFYRYAQHWEDFQVGKNPHASTPVIVDDQGKDDKMSKDKVMRKLINSRIPNDVLIVPHITMYDVIDVVNQLNLVSYHTNMAVLPKIGTINDSFLDSGDNSDTTNESDSDSDFIIESSEKLVIPPKLQTSAGSLQKKKKRVIAPTFPLLPHAIIHILTFSYFVSHDLQTLSSTISQYSGYAAQPMILAEKLSALIDQYSPYSGNYMEVLYNVSSLDTTLLFLSPSAVDHPIDFKNNPLVLFLAQLIDHCCLTPSSPTQHSSHKLTSDRSLALFAFHAAKKGEKYDAFYHSPSHLLPYFHLQTQPPNYTSFIIALLRDYIRSYVLPQFKKHYPQFSDLLSLQNISPNYFFAPNQNTKVLFLHPHQTHDIQVITPPLDAETTLLICATIISTALKQNIHPASLSLLPRHLKIISNILVDFLPLQASKLGDDNQDNRNDGDGYPQKLSPDDLQYHIVLYNITKKYLLPYLRYRLYVDQKYDFLAPTRDGAYDDDNDNDDDDANNVSSSSHHLIFETREQIAAKISTQIKIFKSLDLFEQQMILREFLTQSSSSHLYISALTLTATAQGLTRNSVQNCTTIAVARDQGVISDRYSNIDSLHLTFLFQRALIQVLSEHYFLHHVRTFNVGVFGTTPVDPWALSSGNADETGSNFDDQLCQLGEVCNDLKLNDERQNQDDHNYDLLTINRIDQIHGFLMTDSVDDPFG